jgi:hypothetical protein
MAVVSSPNPWSRPAVPLRSIATYGTLPPQLIEAAITWTRGFLEGPPHRRRASLLLRQLAGMRGRRRRAVGALALFA